GCEISFRGSMRKDWPMMRTAWVGWLKSIALLGLRELAPMVYRAFHDGRAPDWVIGRKDFDEMRGEAERAAGRCRTLRSFESVISRSGRGTRMERSSGA